MKKFLSSAVMALMLAACGAVHADPVNSAAVAGNSGPIDQKHIGDTNQTQSDVVTKTDMTGNANAAMGNTINPVITTDVRNQATGGEGGQGTGGASAANGNRSENTAVVGDTTTGPSSAWSGGNTVAGGAVTGTNTNDVKGGAASSLSSSAGGGGGTGTGGTGTGGESNATSQQKQGIQGSGNSRLQGGDQNAANTTTNNIDLTRSDVSRTNVWASILHGAGAAPMAVGNMSVLSDAQCGPQVSIVRRELVGNKFNNIAPDSTYNNGWDEITAPAAKPFSIHGPYLMGHLVTTYMQTVGSSTASAWSIGGVSKDSALQGGANGGGTSTQLAARVRVRECVVMILSPEMRKTLLAFDEEGYFGPQLQDGRALAAPAQQHESRADRN